MLREIIGAEVLPRLLDANWANPERIETGKLARLLVEGRDDDFRCEIGGRLASGASPFAIMTGVLAPVARELGSLWYDDDCDLIDMQRASGALKRWISEIGPCACERTSGRSPSILVQVAPGETHTLGVDIAEALFRGSGWSVDRGEGRGFQAELAEHWRDVVGFSLSCDRHIDSLKRAIAEAREASRNPGLVVLVGGPIFAEHLGLAAKLGADFCACTAETTVRAPHALLDVSTTSNMVNISC
ncbi:cobalamin B12-binding domain-containing protein [uncultured Rhodoblastus sp.]|uniref:cobalamin B12-binding domain-containing protein n=1 Tax=uncultured Rhodoblastus sp. TaxID=543037 RepID=UPI0025D94869|nr:cobalamin B12-binding domain-containing protein [uncultured Rhodoblastus sp.]